MEQLDDSETIAALRMGSKDDSNDAKGQDARSQRDTGLYCKPGLHRFDRWPSSTCSPSRFSTRLDTDEEEDGFVDGNEAHEQDEASEERYAEARLHRRHRTQEQGKERDSFEGIVVSDDDDVEETGTERTGTAGRRSASLRQNSCPRESIRRVNTTYGLGRTTRKDDPLRMAERQALLERIRELSSKEAETAAALAQVIDECASLEEDAREWERVARDANASLQAAREALADVSAENARLTAAYSAQRLENDSLRRQLEGERIENEARVEALEAALAAARAEAEVNIFSDGSDAESSEYFPRRDVHAHDDVGCEESEHSVHMAADYRDPFATPKSKGRGNAARSGQAAWDEERTELLSLLERLQEQLALHASKRDSPQATPSFSHKSSVAMDKGEGDMHPWASSSRKSNLGEGQTPDCSKTLDIEEELPRRPTFGLGSSPHGQVNMGSRRQKEGSAGPESMATAEESRPIEAHDAANPKAMEHRSVESLTEGSHTPKVQEGINPRFNTEETCTSSGSSPLSSGSKPSRAKDVVVEDSHAIRNGEKCGGKDAVPEKNIGGRRTSPGAGPGHSRVSPFVQSVDQEESETNTIDRQRDTIASSASSESSLDQLKRFQAAGRLLLQARQFDEALKQFCTALSAVKDHEAKGLISSILCDRALTWSYLGRPLEAAIDCCKAEHLDDSCKSRAADIRVSSYAAMGAFDLAVEELSAKSVHHATPSLDKKLQTMRRKLSAGGPRNLYAVLAIPPTASLSAVKAAYKARVKMVHPDKASKELGPHAATTLFSLLSEAHATLSNNQTRRSYDLQLLRFKYSNGEETSGLQRTTGCGRSARKSSEKGNQGSGGAGWGPPRV